MRLSTCELGCKALVPVCEDVLHLVVLPRVEHLRHVHVIGVVRATLSGYNGNIHNIV